MTREQLQQYFPDIYQFFSAVPDTHPFWQAAEHVHIDDAKAGRTLFSDLEQVFSALYLVDGHHVLRERLADMQTHQELMGMLTQLYVAYLYREHQPRLVEGEHGYAIELTVADQLLAMGIVQFQNFEAPEIQFAPQIEDEIQHLHTLEDEDGDGKESPEEFFAHVAHHAGTLKEHPQANHQVMAAVTNYAALPEHLSILQYVADHPEEMKKNFPHIAGIVLVDPTPGKEQARFVPFHQVHNELEQLLEKSY